MKKIEIKAALAALRDIKVSKIGDREFRDALITNHTILLQMGREFDTALQDLQTVHLGAYMAESEIVTDLNTRLQLEVDKRRAAELYAEIQAHTDYRHAVKTYNELARQLGNEPVKRLRPLDWDKFVEVMTAQDACTPGLLEDVYPMFFPEEEPKSEEKKPNK